jgi:hypothetical protein
LTRVESAQSICKFEPEPEPELELEFEPVDSQFDEEERGAMMEEDSDVLGASTQPSETASQKRRATQEAIRQGKRPCRDELESSAGRKPKGVVLQGLDKQSHADFRASLVFTTIL